MKSCETCQVSKRRVGAELGEANPPTVEFPFDRVAMDQSPALRVRTWVSSRFCRHVHSVHLFLSFEEKANFQGCGDGGGGSSGFSTWGSETTSV